MTRVSAVVSRGSVLALTLVLVSRGSTALGQVVPPPPPPGAQVVSADLDPLAGRMGREVQELGEAISVDLGNTELGRHLMDDTRELAQAVGEFQQRVRTGSDRFQARRAYAGIDASWHHLYNQLSRPGTTTPAIDRATRGVARSDAQLHAALGVNDYPPGYFGGEQPLSGVADLQRLVHALVDRAEALAAVVRVDLAGPGGGRLVQESVNLAQAADTFHDSLDVNGQINGTTRNAFSVVDGLSDRLEADLGQVQVTPRVRDAWQSYRSAEVLVHQTLGLPNAPAELTNTVLVTVQGGDSPVVGLADQLVQQVGAFVQVFSQTARAVPEGGLFLNDAQALLAAATNFRQDTTRAGITPAQLAFEFRDVDAVWQRLARRTERIARGRTGPNIQQVGVMGQTISEIHRLLAIPGYAPVVGP